MSATTLDLRSLSPAARLEAKAEAVRVLAAGGLIIAPADTGYLLCADATHPIALNLSRAAGANNGPAVWLAPTVDALGAAAGDLSAVHTKLIHALAPGPAIFVIHLSEQALGDARKRLGIAPGVIDSGGALRARIPGDSLAAAISARARSPICSWEPLDDSHAAFATADEAATAAHAAGLNPTLILQGDTPTAGGKRKRPTIIALERTGAIRILQEGAYETRYVMKQSTLNILFVCTGNTCRSPMAEGIASALVARRARGAPKESTPTVHIASAGVGAANGSPRTPEGSTALRERGFEPAPGSSHPLTRQMIAEADRIYTMTRSHLEGVLALDPAARGKASTLDPSGDDIPDPIGLAQEAYNDVAGRLEGLLQERLKEWMP